MSSTPIVNRLVDTLRCLPGIGPKSAQRMAFYLLERNRQGGIKLAEALTEAMTLVGRCQDCRNFSETEQCVLCLNPKRDNKFLCIVESPADVNAIEQTRCFSGLYFVLGGHLSPIDGIGPNEIGLDLLAAKLSSGTVSEIILATNPTIEGEATAHYISELAKPFHIKTTRIAYGVPIGGELEYIDAGTLAKSFTGRIFY